MCSWTGMGVWMGLWGLLAVLVLIAVLVFAALGSVWLIRRLRGDGKPVVGTDAARETLRHRYATGEIDEEEYERRLSALTWR